MEDVVHKSTYAEVVLVPFFSIEYKKVLLMKLEDFRRTGGNSPRLIAGWEVILEDVIQPIYQKYAKDVLKIENILIQFLVALVFEEECYFAIYWNELKRETEMKEVNLKYGEFLKRAGYLDKVYVAEGKLTGLIPTSSEGKTDEEDSTVGEQEQ
jgi:hypothetical protein